MTARTSPIGRRLATLALLLALPLTLAPRTSFTLLYVDYNLLVSSPRASIPVGAAQPVVFTAASRSDEVIEQVKLTITVSVDGDGAAAQVMAVGEGCSADGNVVECTLGPVAPRSQVSARVTARGLSKGLLQFDVAEGFRGEDFGTYRLEVVAKRQGPRTTVR